MRIQIPVLLLAAALTAAAQIVPLPPAVSAGGVVNTAGPVPGQAVAPGSLVTIFGTNLASSLASSGTVPLSTTLNGVTVTVNNVGVPIQFVSSGQINIQMPWSVPLSDDQNGPAQVVVTRDDGALSTATPVIVAATAPALYSIGTQAIAVNADGSLAAPAGAIPGFNTHAAALGDPAGIMLLATGLGAVDQPIADGANSSDQVRNTVVKPTVLVGGVPAQVVFSGLSPQFVGVNQINIVLDPSTPTGSAVPVQIRINDTAITNPVFIAVSQ